MAIRRVIFVNALPYCVGRHLLFIADHNMFASQVKSGQCGHIALTGLIYDNDIEFSFPRIEVLPKPC